MKPLPSSSTLSHTDLPPYLAKCLSTPRSSQANTKHPPHHICLLLSSSTVRAPSHTSSLSHRILALMSWLSFPRLFLLFAHHKETGRPSSTIKHPLTPPVRHNCPLLDRACVSQSCIAHRCLVFRSCLCLMCFVSDPYQCRCLAPGVGRR